jgi:hypothetical protein
MDEGQRFGSWRVRSLNRSGLLTTLARELAWYKLHLVHIQNKGSDVRTRDYTFFYGKKMKIIQWEQEFL